MYTRRMLVFSQEGSAQGDPLSTMYAIATVPLNEKLHSSDKHYTSRACIHLPHSRPLPTKAGRGPASAMQGPFMAVLPLGVDAEGG